MRKLGSRTAALLLGLATGVSGWPVAAAERDNAFPIQERLTTVKSRLLQLQRPAAEAKSHVYLNVAPALPLRSAQLQVLNAEDAVVARIDFQPSSGEQGLLRAALPAAAREERSCRFVIVTVREESVDRRAVACRLPEMRSAPMLEVRYREGWLGSELKIRAWRPDAETGAGRRGFQDADIKRLLGRLLPSATSGSLTSLEGGRAVAPDVRYSVVMCARDPWRSLNWLYGYKRRSPDSMPAAFWRAYADCALRAGVHGEAVAALQELQSRGDAELAVYETRLQLAAYHQQWGDTAGALHWLDVELAKVPVVLRSRWRDRLSRLYLDQGRFEDAVTLLSEGQHLEAAGSWLESFDAAPLHYVMRMNYAYSLMRAGRQPEALAVLERVGSSPALDPETGALRAQANTVLGWHFLAQGYGATAARLFHRVPVESHVARKALLGMGWAMLAPEGEAKPLVDPPGFAAAPSDPPATTLKSLRQIDAIGCAQYNAVAPDAVQECISAERFERVGHADDEGKQLRRALRFWTALLEEQGVRDAAGLEARIAAASTYDELGDRQRARALYRQALASSEEALASLDRMEGTFGDRSHWLALTSREYAVLDEDAWPAVFDWLARTRTQTLLEAVATTQRLSQQIGAALETRLRRTEQGVELSRLGARLDAVREQAIGRLHQSLTTVIAQERGRFERYRVQALLGLAEMQRSGAAAGESG